MPNLLSSLISKGADAALIKKMFSDYKKGKTEEQKQVIDFFASHYVGGGCSGCLTMSTSPYTLEQYQAKVQEKCGKLNIKQRAIERIGLDESQISEIAPILIHDFDFDNLLDDHGDFNKSDLNFCVVKDAVAVAAKYSVSWIFFSALQLYTYTIEFNMTSDDVTEYTREYFYQDITCFETLRTVTEKINVKMGQGCGCIKGKEKITKSHIAHTALRITVPNSEFFVPMRDQGAQTQSIHAAKALVRERKFVK